MRKIILVGPIPPAFTGQSISFQMLTEGLKEHNIDFRVINISGKAINNNDFSWNRLWEYVPILINFFRKTIFGKKVIYITIAQSRYGFLRDMIMIWFAWLNKHDIVCHLKGGNYNNFYFSQPKWYRWIIRKTLLKTKYILVLGEKLIGMFDFEPKLKSKIHVVHNGLPFSQKIASTPKKLPKDPTQPIIILYLSNLIESKGYFDVLEAVRILVKENNILIKCYFCGLFLANKVDDVKVKNPKHGYKLFKKFIIKHKLQNNIIYLGPISGENKINILKKSHFFILPTNYNNEGQPVSIIEAMTYGNVVISTNYRAIPDMIIDKITGFLVPYNCPWEIAQIIMELISNPKIYSKISREAINHSQNHFSRKIHLKRILQFLK